MIDVDYGLQRAREAMPIFPLPRSVLMPGAHLPLHVFEPRYRELVAHCRNGWELMAIGTLMPGYEADYEGRPEIWPVVGIGRLVAYQELPDGRSNILLQYVARGRIVEENPPRHSFREVRLDLLQTRPPPDTAVYDEVRSLVHAVGAMSGEAAEASTRLLGLEGSELLDTLARKLLRTTDEQRLYLAEDRIEARGKQVLGALGEVLAAASVGAAEA